MRIVTEVLKTRGMGHLSRATVSGVVAIAIGIILILAGLGWILIGPPEQALLGLFPLIIGIAIVSVFIWPVPEANKRIKYRPETRMPGMPFSIPIPTVDQEEDEPPHYD